MVEVQGEVIKNGLENYKEKREFFHMLMYLSLI